MTEKNSTDITPEMQAFFERVDGFIAQANNHLNPETHSGQVGASLLYAAARYSASVSSIGFENKEDFADEKEKIIEFYVNQYRQMLTDNLNDYVKNFDKYTQFSQKTDPDNT